MAWIEAHQGLGNHIKTIKLRKTLKMKKTEVIGTLLLLWWWAMDNAPEGDLKDLEEGDLAEICEYKGKQNLFDALIDAGFVDADKKIHDWEDYIGKLIDRRKADAERKRTSRRQTPDNRKKSEARPQDILKTSERNPQDIPKTSCVTVPYRTEPYHTIPKSPCLSSNIDGENEPETAPEDSELHRLKEPERTQEEQKRDDYLKACSDFYLQTHRTTMPSIAITYIQEILKDNIDPDLITFAISSAQGKSNPASYFISILKDKIARGIKTKAQLDAFIEKNKEQAPPPPQKKQYFSDPNSYAGISMDTKKGG